MSRFIFALFLSVLVFSVPVQAQEPIPFFPGLSAEERAEVPNGPFELCDRHFGSLALAYREITNDLYMPMIDEDELYEYYEDYESGRTFILAKSNFEAYPTILCKEIVKQGQKTFKSVTMFCGASQEICARLQEAIDGQL
tara:strand:- start:872 stop:1291 length:420 start_codon:yes stop_codon:yes gene_type:complete